ncbi:MAG: hypothetical protein AAFP88_03230, partial [Bacteroidota bacterium]
ARLELYELHLAVFQVKEMQYEELEIAPLVYLNARIKIKQEELGLREKYWGIFKLRDDIIHLAKAELAPLLL